jgi:hypothetical protein
MNSHPYDVAFIITANSLSNSLLFRSVDSIRLQAAFNWVLHVCFEEESATANTLTLTHGNPRVQLHRFPLNRDACSREAKYVCHVPVGTELWPNASIIVTQVMDRENPLTGIFGVSEFSSTVSQTSSIVVSKSQTDGPETGIFHSAHVIGVRNVDPSDFPPIQLPDISDSAESEATSRWERQIQEIDALNEKVRQLSHQCHVQEAHISNIEGHITALKEIADDLLHANNLLNSANDSLVNENQSIRLELLKDKVDSSANQVS